DWRTSGPATPRRGFLVLLRFAGFIRRRLVQVLFVVLVGRVVVLVRLLAGPRPLAPDVAVAPLLAGPVRLGLLLAVGRPAATPLPAQLPVGPAHGLTRAARGLTGGLAGLAHGGLGVPQGFGPLVQAVAQRVDLAGHRGGGGALGRVEQFPANGIDD